MYSSKRQQKHKFQVSYGPRKSLRTGPSCFSSVHFIPPHARMSQKDTHGVDQGAADSDTFGHIFLVFPTPHSTLIKFQNISPQHKSTFHPMSRLNSRHFWDTHASVALYAEHGLNESNLLPCNLFHHRMQVNSLGTLLLLIGQQHS